METSSYEPRPLVVISRKIPSMAINLIKKECEVRLWQEERVPTKAELMKLCQDADALVSLLSDTIDSDFLTYCPKLKVIANYAVGFNNIDLTEANKRGIAVGNTPDVLTEATADLALTLLLCLTRNLPKAIDDVHQGRWKCWEPLGYLGPELKGKTLGIYGMGRIGTSLALKCAKAWDMRIIYHNRSAKDSAFFDKYSFEATYVDFETLCRESDFLSLHAPLMPENFQVFNREAFRLMKNDAYLVNTARGGLCDEKALYESLCQGELAGAGLDVTDPEPMSPENPLLQLKQVIVSPHIGSATKEAREQMANLTAQNILHGLKRKPLPGFVNPQVF